ncbi:DUF421 domain-containing protein [Thermoleophilum album]|uniref:DUF421 domain-containing protein n=1 Tax=Thermoleophilum album TaxID=29539 RepID=UPI0015A5ADFB|nr:YetF domain-containing protein [Thermoleophilum album]
MQGDPITVAATDTAFGWLVVHVTRPLVVFAFLVLALRLGGKRELAQASVLDLAVLLIVSEALQNSIIGSDTSLQGGLVAAGTLFATNYAFARLLYRSPRARRLLEGTPRVLVEDGKILVEACRREAITEDELRSIARESGFERLEDVGLMVLEPNGHISVMGPRAAEHWRRQHPRADRGRRTRRRRPGAKE